MAAPSLTFDRPTYEGTLTTATSTVGDVDEYDRVCGVCLDAGDFIAMQPCRHKICGE